MLNFILVICGVMLAGTVSVLFGYTLCTGGLIVASSKQSVDCFYLVETAVATEYKNATSVADEIRLNGGAGYISYDDGYHIFVAGYLTKKDAEKICNQNNDIKNLKVYKLNIGQFNQDNGFSQNFNLILKNNVIVFKRAIENLNQVLQEYDKNNIDEMNVRSTCLLIREELDLQIEKFMDKFYQDTTLYKYKSYIYEFRELIDTIINLDSSGIDFSRTARYQEISCMFCLKNIMAIV